MKLISYNQIKSRGFTLIELLVVISIISLLSSIVLASLNSARTKARDVAIKQEMIQFRNLIEQNYSDTSGYSFLQINEWNNVSADCDRHYGQGSYIAATNPAVAIQALTICKKIVNLVNPSDVSVTSLLVGNQAGHGSLVQEKYSVNVLNVGVIYCVSGSGVNFSAASYDDPSCYYSP